MMKVLLRVGLLWIALHVADTAVTPDLPLPSHPETVLGRTAQTIFEQERRVEEWLALGGSL